MNAGECYVDDWLTYWKSETSLVGLTLAPRPVKITDVPSTSSPLSLRADPIP